LNSSKIVFSNLPEVTCQCYNAPFAFTEMITFLVTAGQASGRHLMETIGIFYSISVFKTNAYLPVNML